MCNKKDRLHAKMIKKPSLENIDCFRMFRKKEKMAIRRAQRDYHEKKIEKCTSSKQMFQAFNLFFVENKNQPKKRLNQTYLMSCSSILVST